MLLSKVEEQLRLRLLQAFVGIHNAVAVTWTGIAGINVNPYVFGITFSRLGISLRILYTG